jgi:hypothetical protein
MIICSEETVVRGESICVKELDGPRDGGDGETIPHSIPGIRTVILFLFRKNSQPIDTAHEGIFGPGTKRPMFKKCKMET